MVRCKTGLNEEGLQRYSSSVFDGYQRPENLNLRTISDTSLPERKKYLYRHLPLLNLFCGNLSLM